jgi:hypothetical protein
VNADDDVTALVPLMLLPDIDAASSCTELAAKEFSDCGSTALIYRMPSNVLKGLCHTTAPPTHVKEL